MHPTALAGTRLRLEQYRGHLDRRGLELVVWTFLRDDDLSGWYGTSNARRAAVLLRALVRLPWCLLRLPRPSVVIVQGEALPLRSLLVERFLARSAPLVWDVDDAMWAGNVSPTAGRLVRLVRGPRKYVALARVSSQVWAGSEVLATWCRQHSSNVQVVPTVVEVPEHEEAVRGRSVGWIGSHSTGPFVERVLPALLDVEPPPDEVVLVGAQVSAPPALRAVCQSWTPEAEASALHRMRVGLYPISREHALAEGKCGLKAILYMAHGIPCVVTPTTTNRAVVRDGADGFYADSLDTWRDKVQRLLDDDDLWLRMSRAARARARADFSLERWGPWVAEHVTRLASRSDVA